VDADRWDTEPVLGPEPDEGHERDRRVAMLLRVNRPGPEPDPEGMGAARSWRPVP
jgi:hypothetical protein